MDESSFTSDCILGFCIDHYTSLRWYPGVNRPIVSNHQFRTWWLLLFLVLASAGGCANLPPGYPYKIESRYAVDDPQFARSMGHLLGPPLVYGNDVKTLVNGDQIFSAML